MIVLTLANQKGGVGKTTLTCLLAYYLAHKQNARVAAIDVDNQRNLSHTLRQYALGVSSLALFGDTPLNLPPTRPPITLFEASAKLADVEREADPRRRLQTFTRQVRSLESHFDYCLIDPPPTLGIRMIASLTCADAVVIPIELEEYSTQGVRDMLKTVVGVRQQFNPRLKLLGLLANRVAHNSARQKDALRQLFEAYPQDVLRTKISTRTAIPRALEEGVPVWTLRETAAREAGAEVLHALDTVFRALTAAMGAQPLEIA